MSDALVRRPCDFRWDELQGPGPHRHCARCDRAVHDLGAMSEAERRALAEGPTPCVYLSPPLLAALAAREPARAEDVEALGASLEEALAEQAGALEALYEERRAEHPRLAGALVLRFTIAGGGVVLAEVERDTLGDEVLQQAVLALVRGLRLEHRPGAVVVSYPFAFG